MGAPVAGKLARPEWLKVKLQDWDSFRRTEEVVETHGLNTVCHSAACPNIADCWSRGTATLMLLGNVCTRRCGFCAVLSGVPSAFDPRARLILIGALAYFVLPFDFVPDIIFGVGFLDDATILAAAIASVRSSITEDHREAARQALAEGSDDAERKSEAANA